MNSDEPNASQTNQEQNQPAPNSNLTDLVDTLQSVNTETPDAVANSTSISDNNGGRIELNDEPEVTK